MNHEIQETHRYEAGGRSFESREEAQDWLGLLAWSREHVRSHYRLKEDAPVERRARHVATGIEAFNAGVTSDAAPDDDEEADR